MLCNQSLQVKRVSKAQSEETNLRLLVAPYHDQMFDTTRSVGGSLGVLGPCDQEEFDRMGLRLWGW